MYICIYMYISKEFDILILRVEDLPVEASWEGPRATSRGRPTHHSHEATYYVLWNNPASSKIAHH